MNETLVMIDKATGRELERCSGPAADGSCPRVTRGEILPCAGHALELIGPDGPTVPYDVSEQATICPVTLAAATAIPTDSPLETER